MPIFISYSRADAHFVDVLARNLVANKHHVWMDRWELNVGDSLIDRIQSALTSSSAVIIILSKNSVASEWCKKELNSTLMRELSEKQALLLPCVIDDCDIPLFVREKLYADFRSDPDAALKQVNDALLRITNRQQGRIESPDFHTDWGYDWKTGKSTGFWYFDWTFVDHGASIEYCVLTHLQMVCNSSATKAFQLLNDEARQQFIQDSIARASEHVSGEHFKILLKDAFEVVRSFVLEGPKGQSWLVEIASRRLGVDPGKDTLVHIDLMLERAVEQMKQQNARPGSV